MLPKMRCNVLLPGLTMLYFTGATICPAAGADPVLIPRLIVVRLSPNCPDFEAADAHTFVVRPTEPTGALPFATQDPEEIAAVLAANLAGEIDDPDELWELATFVAAELNSSALLFQDSLLVTTHGVETPEILWNVRYPESTIAQAGATGDIMSLGHFIAYKLDITTDPIPTDEYGDWRITTVPQTGATWNEFCLSIGWFRR
jgi:hypothetical protein